MAEIRYGSRMEKRLTELRGGGELRKKEKTATRNGGVEDTD